MANKRSKKKLNYIILVLIIISYFIYTCVTGKFELYYWIAGCMEDFVLFFALFFEVLYFFIVVLISVVYFTHACVTGKFKLYDWIASCMVGFVLIFVVFISLFLKDQKEKEEKEKK